MMQLFYWIGNHLTDLCFTFFSVWFFGSFLHRLTKAKIPWNELIYNPRTKTIDYKMLMMMICASFQSMAWIRMAFGYKVDPALAKPALWMTFYAVIAGHDVLSQWIDAWSKTQRPQYDNDGGFGGQGLGMITPIQPMQPIQPNPQNAQPQEGLDAANGITTPVQRGPNE